jgi:hypothetical protein
VAGSKLPRDYPVSPMFHLRQLGTEYARMWRLDGFTPTTRGQRFNGLLAEMFEAWGHRSLVDTNEHGNMDVAFAIGETRFVLEAKWEADKTPIDPITKLQKRVKQRLGGTIGVFVSMAGYTDPALRDLKDGERLEVILLTRDHVEAMLTGFCPPEELFELMLDEAHFHGVPTRSLAALLRDNRPKGLPVIAGDSLGSSPASRLAPGVNAKWLAFRSIPPGQSGLSVRPDGRLLVVTGMGLLEVDPATQTSEWLPAPADITDVKAVGDGSVMVIRRLGVARLDAGGGLRVIDGPFPGRARFTIDCFATDEVTVWCNDIRGVTTLNSSRGAHATLGDAPGEAKVIETKAATGGAAAARIAPDVTLLLGNPAALEDNRVASAVTFPISNPFAAAPLGDDVLVGGGSIDIVRCDDRFQSIQPFASLDLRPSVIDLAADPTMPGTVYAMAHANNSDAMSIVRLWVDPTPTPSPDEGQGA